jgi:hypothetical protein
MTDLTLVDDALGTVGSAGEAALDTIVGSAALALDSVTRPRRSAGRARRRGSSVNETATEAAEELIDEATSLPGRALLGYVRLLRRQGTRGGVVGRVSRGVLGAVHGQAREAARFFIRLERETDVDRHGHRRTRAGSTARRAKSGTTARRTAARGTTTRSRSATGRRRTAPRTRRSA